MLALEERFMIREMYRKGVSISEIARWTGRDRKTIKHPRQVKACKIDPYAPYLEQRMAERPFQSEGKPTAWLSMVPSSAHSLMLEMSPRLSASAHKGYERKQDGTFITSEQFAPRLEWSLGSITLSSK
jgi:hypothetical protein